MTTQSRRLFSTSSQTRTMFEANRLNRCCSHQTMTIVDYSRCDIPTFTTAVHFTVLSETSENRLDCVASLFADHFCFPQWCLSSQRGLSGKFFDKNFCRSLLLITIESDSRMNIHHFQELLFPRNVEFHCSSSLNATLDHSCTRSASLFCESPSDCVRWRHFPFVHLVASVIQISPVFNVSQ
jgi:hypothetical protein